MNPLHAYREGQWIMKPLGVWFILVALANPAWAESALFPKNRWFAVDALNGTSLRGKGLTLFVEPEVVSGAAFAKGFGGCNDWHSWFDTAEGTEVSFSQFTDSKRVCSDKPMQIEKDYLAALAKVKEFRLEGEMLSLTGDGVTLGEARCVMPRRFPAPWTVEKIPGGFKVLDANGQALVYCYSRETERDAQNANVLTEDEARRIAANIAKLSTLLPRK